MKTHYTALVEHYFRLGARHPMITNPVSARWYAAVWEFFDNLPSEDREFLLKLFGSHKMCIRDSRVWRAKKPDSETGRLLEMFNDLCADVLNQSALRNNANSVFSIFISKALYGLRDSTEVIITPRTEDLASESEYSVDEIRRRYVIDAPDDSDES